MVYVCACSVILVFCLRAIMTIRFFGCLNYLFSLFSTFFFGFFCGLRGNQVVSSLRDVWRKLAVFRETSVPTLGLDFLAYTFPQISFKIVISLEKFWQSSGKLWCFTLYMLFICIFDDSNVCFASYSCLNIS